MDDQLEAFRYSEMPKMQQLVAELLMSHKVTQWQAILILQGLFLTSLERQLGKSEAIVYLEQLVVEIKKVKEEETK